MPRALKEKQKQRTKREEGGSLQAKNAYTFHVRNHDDPAAGSALAEEKTSLFYDGMMYISGITRGVFNHAICFN